MKKSIVVFIFVIFANVIYAQTNLKDIIKDCVFRISENEKMETIVYTNTNGEKVTCSFDEISALLRKDVIGYYGLDEKYNTELKVKTYKQTADYNDKNSSMMKDYNFLTQGKGFLMYNLRYNSNFNTAQRCFSFKIGFDDLYRYSTPNFLCFENGIALTYPNTYLTRTRERTSLASNGFYNYNILKTTSIPETVALKIENEMENPYCHARLLIIFKLTKSAIEKKQVANYLIPQNFVIGKTIGAYLVNEETGEVYADMSRIFSK